MALTEAQRAYRARKRAARLALPPIPCACGCGTLIPPVRDDGTPRRYARGHQLIGKGNRFRPGQPAWNKGRAWPEAAERHRGKTLPLEEIARRTATRLERSGGLYNPQQTLRARARTTAEPKGRPDQSGANNPFFGRKHTPEALAKMRAAHTGVPGKKHPPEVRARIAAAHTGPLHPKWKGGIGTLPYGPGFTRAFKRLIRDRDHHRCQRCGATRPPGKAALPVHHVDRVKTNNDPTNLITLCVPCHKWADRNPTQPIPRFDPLP